MRKPDPDCCLCGLPYERIGNNPYPLYAGEGRCCDACNEIVIEARINGDRIKDEIERVEEALLRKPRDMALAAICASRGPVLWAKKQHELEQLRTLKDRLIRPSLLDEVEVRTAKEE